MSGDGFRDLWVRQGADNALRVYRGDGRGGLTGWTHIGWDWNMHDAMF